jgi:hypothetical protein
MPCPYLSILMASKTNLHLSWTEIQGQAASPRTMRQMCTSRASGGFRGTRTISMRTLDSSSYYVGYTSSYQGYCTQIQKGAPRRKSLVDARPRAIGPNRRSL